MAPPPYHPLAGRSRASRDPSPPRPREHGLCRSLFLAAGRIARESPWADRIQTLSLVFIDADGANALAVEDGPRRAIALQTGLVRRLWSLVRLAVGRSALLSESFSSPPPERDMVLRPGVEGLASLYGDPRADWRVDRADILVELFMYALDFIVNHELAHHARGHLDLLHQAGGQRLVDEALALDAGGASTQARLMQLIEFDADINAIDLILHSDLQEGLRSWIPDRLRGHAFKLMLASILVFIALDLEHRPVGEPWTGSHPAPILRAMWATHAVATTFAENGLLTAADAREEQEDAWGQAADVAEALGLPPGRWWGVGDLSDFTPLLDGVSADAVTFSLELDVANRG